MQEHFATDVQLRVGAHGKPQLSPHPHSDIEFNLSHSGATVALAFARNVALGIDIEPIPSSEPPPSLLSSILTPNELKTYHALETHLKPPAFARAWTRKEAMIKGMGKDFSLDIRSVEVDVDPRARAQLLQSCDSNIPGQWRMDALDLLPRYACALASQGDGHCLRTFALNDV